MGSFEFHDDEYWRRVAEQRTETVATTETALAPGGSAPAPGWPALRWSAEKPAAEGWWWCDDPDYEKPCVRRVVMFAGLLRVYLPMNNISGQSWIAIRDCLPQWRWAGPLPEPLEASDAATPANPNQAQRQNPRKPRSLCKFTNAPTAE